MICDFPSPPVSQAWIFWSPSQVTSAGCVTNSTIATLLPGSHTASPWCILRTFRLDPLAIAWPGICYPHACLFSESTTLAVLSSVHFHHPWCPLCHSFLLVCSMFVSHHHCRSKTSPLLLPGYCCCHLVAHFWLEIFLRVLCLLNLWSLLFSLGLFSVRQTTGGSRWGKNKSQRLFLLKKAGTYASFHAILQEQLL